MPNIRLSERFERQAQDFADLQNEVAGRDVGRMERFLGEASENHIDRDKSRSKREALLTSLQIMMANDPEYAQLFRQTETGLREVQNRLDEALQAIQRERERIEERLRSQLTDTERREEVTCSPEKSSI